jgi:hypothetical protein
MTDITEQLERAANAKRLLDSPALQAAFAEVREAIVHRIEQCPMRDTEGAEKLRIMLKLLNDVRANLEGAISDGKVTQFRLSQDEQDKKRRVSLFR